MTTTTPTCSLDRGELARRLTRWQLLRDRAEVDACATKTGFRLVFRSEEGVENELRDLLALERSCCGFADWSLGHEADRIVVDVCDSDQEGTTDIRRLFLSGRAQAPQGARGWRAPSALLGAVGAGCLACLLPGLLAAGALGAAGGAIGGPIGLTILAGALAIAAALIYRRRKANAANRAGCRC